MGSGVGPWGDRAPRAPRPGAGREALARRAQARGGAEKRRAAEAARRGLRRADGRGGSGRRLKLPQWKMPRIRALSEIVRWSGAFQQKYLQRQRVRSVLLILVGMWLVWTFVLGDASVPRLFAVRRENGQLAEEVRRLREEQAGLQAEVSALKSERQDRAVERIARDRHAMIKDGEVLVKFYDEDGGRPGEGPGAGRAAADDPAERVLSENARREGR